MKPVEARPPSAGYRFGSSCAGTRAAVMRGEPGAAGAAGRGWPGPPGAWSTGRGSAEAGSGGEGATRSGRRPGRRRRRRHGWPSSKPTPEGGAETNLAFADRKGTRSSGRSSPASTRRGTTRRWRIHVSALARQPRQAVKELEGRPSATRCEVAAMQNTLGRSLLGLGEPDAWRSRCSQKCTDTRTAPGSAPTTPTRSQHEQPGGGLPATPGSWTWPCRCCEETLKLHEGQARPRPPRHARRA